MFTEPVTRAGSFQSIVRENLKRQMELEIEFFLPLLDKVPRADDQTALQIAARDQFLNEQASHDRLAGSGIIGQPES